MRSFCYFQLFVTWGFSARNIVSGRSTHPLLPVRAQADPVYPLNNTHFLTSLPPWSIISPGHLLQFEKCPLVFYQDAEEWAHSQEKSRQSSVSNSSHRSRQSACEPGWPLPCPIHKQTASCFNQEIQFLHVSFGTSRGSVQGVSQHISISCRSCTIPSVPTGTCVCQLGTTSSPGLPKGQLDHLPPACPGALQGAFTASLISKLWDSDPECCCSFIG